MSSCDILPPEAGDSVSAGFSGSAGAEGSAGAFAANSFSMSSCDILPPEGVSSAGFSGALSSTISGMDSVLSSPKAEASSFSMSSWDIVPPDGSWERVEGSTCGSGTASGAGCSSEIPAERSSASISSSDILLFSITRSGSYETSGAMVTGFEASCIMLETSNLCWFRMLSTSADLCGLAGRPGRVSAPLG